jgi:N-acylneuraminate cytidylyltransferase
MESNCFTEILVSTDDAEIASVAASFGASVPFLRRPETASDHATTADVLVETLDRLRERKSHYDAVCCLYATAPFATGADLRAGFERLTAGGFEVVVPVTRFHYPILRSLKRGNDGRIGMNWPEYRDTRSQDLPPAYHDAGQWYWFRPEYLLRTKAFFGPETFGYVLPPERVQDIDDDDDWRTAEWKHERLTAGSTIA